MHPGVSGMRECDHPAGHRWSRTSVVDLEAVDHERQIGEVVGGGSDVVRVRVAQRVDFDLTAEPVARFSHPPRITLGETFELSAAQALCLSDHLRVAAAFARQVEESVATAALAKTVGRDGYRSCS